ncbi:hypothetical protein N7476_005699 [Penicillium atrosanguineum]|uniref:Uncharacterized protein n=1 Tax=Penicillium atrosanguineum TaxID=1132637 RepID=A0A9W9U3Q1_9EURO|nr:hypothetical protein N7476_005699 [Penicillium atrosanguineum]
MASSPPEGQGLSMMWWAARNPPANPTTSFAGKTILITGANVGLGFEAALKFATLVRSLNKGNIAREKISQQTGYNANRIVLYELDMSVFSSVTKFTEQVAKESRLDIAILNAGLVAPSYKLSPEGYEMSIQVMVLSTALLAILLLPQLQRSAQIAGTPAHMEFAGSIAGRGIKSDTFSTNTKILDHVNQISFFGAQRQYGVAKLLLLYVLDGLVDSPSKGRYPGVIINAVCPGPCRTSLGRDFPTLLKIPMAAFHAMFARTAEEGARSYVSGVAMGLESHGKFWSADMFFDKGEMVTSSQGKELQQKVWQEILDVLRPHIHEENPIIA